MAMAIAVGQSLPVYAAAGPAEAVSTIAAEEARPDAAEAAALAQVDEPLPDEEAPAEEAPASDEALLEEAETDPVQPEEAAPSETESTPAPGSTTQTEPEQDKTAPVEENPVSAPEEKEAAPAAEPDAAEVSQSEEPGIAVAAAASDAVWSDGFESIVTATNANVKASWKNGKVPANWNNIWLSPAPADTSTTYWEVSSDTKYEGNSAIHLHSEDAAARMDIFCGVSGLSYSQNYVLRMMVKKQNLTKLQVRAQIGDKGNIALPAADIPGGTSDWAVWELPLEDLQSVYDASDKTDKTCQNGYMKVEIFSAAGTTGDVWIDKVEIVTQSDAEAEKGDVLWSMSFDEAVQATGNAAKYFADGTGPKGFMGTWVPEPPDAAKFQLKLDDTTKVSGAYSLYAKSTYPDKVTTSTTSEQRLKLAADSGTYPADVDYTRDYVLRAKVKLNGASHSNWGGAALRVDVARVSNTYTGSFTSDRLLGTKDWQTVELRLTDLDTKTGLAHGKLEPSVMFEYFTGEIWVDDMQLIALGYTLELGQSMLLLNVGESGQLTTNAPADETLTWTSSNESVATVDSTGKVTAVKGGVATITASAGEGNTASCTVSVSDKVTEEAFAAMRGRWAERLTGNSYWKGAETSAEYKAIVEGYDQAAKEALAVLVLYSDTELFSDLNLDFKMYGTSTTSSDDSVAYATAISRIQDMARAWAAKGSEYYQDDTLEEAILYAMQWSYNHFYNENLNNQAMFGNWYHWWISIPQSLAGTVILMRDVMSPELMRQEAAALAHFNADPAYVYKVKGAAGKMDMTGANLADTSLASLLRGAAFGDQAAVLNGTKYFDRLAKVVTSGEGIYADGSFIQHTNLAYTGGYGATLLNGVEKLVYLTTGSAWQISEGQLSTVYDWIWNGIRPLYANGAMFDMVNGRGVARPSSSDLKTGRGILAAVVLLADNAPEARKADLKSFAKGQLQAGEKAMGKDDYYGGMNAAAMMAALALVSDEGVEASPNTGYAHVFGSMDKAVAHSGIFSFGISFASARTGRFEYGNKENAKGWHQSDGATYLYNGDPNQYSDNYWNTVDPHRLAGITTDHSEWPIKDWGNYTGNANFNGGSSVGQYANVAMNFKNYSTSNNSSLSAHKAWFIFDDEIVALGAGINGIAVSRTTETIVENKKLKDDGRNRLVVDGKETAANIDDSEELAGVQWAWLEGNTEDDAVGYYFPETSKLNVLREARTGSWKEINTAEGVDETEYTRTYLSLAVPHGENAALNAPCTTFKNEYYDYVLLPGKTEKEVKAYAENPDIEILCNSSMVQAVRDNDANVTGYLFWGDQNKEIRIGDVGAVKGSVTVVKDADTHTMTVGMADVHQNNASLQFRVYGSGIEVRSCDEGVTAQTDQYGVLFTVNTANAKGKTFTATLSYRDLTEDEKAELAGMRAAYSNSQTGNNMTDKTDAQYRAVMDKYAADAKTALDHLIRSAGCGTSLFDDIDVQLDWTKGNNNTDGSANLTSTANRIQAMALAYTSEGCTEYYHNEQLKKDILFCFKYLSTGFPNILNYQDKIYANWWDWSIGVPKALASAGVLMYDEMDAGARAELYNYLRILVPDSNFCWMRSDTGRGYIYTATAANKAELGMIMAMTGLIGNDPGCLYNARDCMASLLKYVASGEGFYEDGSYKQHGNFAYTGSYGVEMLRGITQVISLIGNTTYACDDADLEILYQWIMNAFRPLYADGGIFDMVQGRSVSRYNRSTITTGRYAMDAILTLAANAPEAYQDKLLSFAKTQTALGVAYDAESYYAKLRFPSLVMARKLLADDSIPLDQELYTKIYGSMDKAVVHGDKFALGISMFSSRNGATECGNKENLKGWYTADGALTLAIGDQAQFDKGYWATVNPLRLNGITTNHVTKDLSNFSIKANDRDWVGGSSLMGNDYASVGMDFASNYSDLQAKKSWFAFGDQIVALGAGIRTTAGDETETIVENRRIDNQNTLVVNGNTAVPADGSDTITADWAWLSANKSGSATGYYFPESTELNLLRETRTGKWSDINQNNYPKGEIASQNEVTNQYLSLAVSHGKNPTAGSYSYVLLPGKTQDETAAYAKANSIAVLANTAEVQAAADTKLGVYGFNFWQAGSVQLPQGSLMTSVAAEQPASVTVWNENGTLHIGVADPTQKSGAVTVTLLGEGLTPALVSSSGTVTAVEGGIRVSVNVGGLHGATVEAVAQAPKPAVTPNPTEKPTEKPTETPAPAAKPAQGSSSAAANTQAPAAQSTAAPAAVPAIPKTLDEFPLIPITAIGAASLAALLFLVYRKKKQ